MISVYDYWREQPRQQVHIGRLASHSIIRTLVSVIEWFGGRWLANRIYESQYRRVLPELNATYIRNKLKLTPEAPEWEEIKKSEKIPVDKAVFEVVEAMDYLKAVKTKKEMESDPRVSLNKADKTNLPDPRHWRDYKRLRKKYRDDSAFDRLTNELKKELPFSELDLAALEARMELLSQGVEPSMLESVANRKTLATSYRWVRSYVSSALWRQLHGIEPLDKAGLQEFEKLQRVVNWHDDGIINFEVREAWENRESFYNFYADLEERFGTPRLKRFSETFVQSPFFRLRTPPMADKLRQLMDLSKTHKPEELLKDEGIVKLLRAERFEAFQRRLKSLGGKKFVQLTCDRLKQPTLSFDTDLEEDPEFWTAEMAYLVLERLKCALLLDEKTAKSHLKEALSKISSLPFPSDFEEKFYSARLGDEYCRLKAKIPSLPSPLEEQLFLLLPLSKNLNEVKKLLRLYCHERARTFLESSQHGLSPLIEDLYELIRPTEIPKTGLPMANIEKLLLLSLSLIQEGKCDKPSLIHLLKGMNLSFRSLTDREADAFFKTFHERSQKAIEKREFLEQGAKPLKRFLWHSLVKTFKALAKTLIVPPDEADSPAFIGPFQLLENRYSSPEGYHQTFKHLQEVVPTHFFFSLHASLLNGLFDAILTDHLTFLVSQLQKTLGTIEADLEHADVETLIKNYNKEPLNATTEAFWFPYIRHLIALLNEVKAFEPSPGETPPVHIHLLKHLGHLKLVVQAVETFKRTRAFGNTLIQTLTPSILQLTLPFCDKQESGALTSLIGLFIPHLLHKHDFMPLSRFLKELDALMESKNSFTAEEERKLAYELTLILKWAVGQLAPYQKNFPLLLRELKSSFPTENNLLQ